MKKAKKYSLLILIFFIIGMMGYSGCDSGGSSSNPPIEVSFSGGIKDIDIGESEFLSATVKYYSGTVEYTWTIISGPGYFVTAPDASSTSVEVMGTGEGLITVGVSVKDGNNHTASASAVINVFPGCDPTGGQAQAYQEGGYLTFDDSPFGSLNLNPFSLEDFEDGVLNTPGLSISGTPAGNPVEGGGVASDTGDGSGQALRLSTDTQQRSLNFNSDAADGYPTHAGFVFYGTDDILTATCYSPSGNFTGVDHKLLNGEFIGFYRPCGIGSITLTSTPHPLGGFFLDHIQYGRNPTLPVTEDTDGDGFDDDQDNCPADFNPEQSDGDGDGLGAQCDNCPADFNPDQVDGDSDGAGDQCDTCPDDPDKIDPGVCGCGVPDIDRDDNGLMGCKEICSDVSGTWTLVVSNVKSSCEPEPGWSSIVTINQFDCSLETTGIKGTSVIVIGSVDGDTVTIGPGFFKEGGGTTTATYTMTIAPDGSMTGTESWTWSGPGGSCTGGTADLTATK
ncbi:MAG: hypothetical protein JRJ65_15825 [Deltaproteobacteria bacterium]|nr:hypothetical protein [Deltaproteobacteria bacterium]